MSVVVPIARVLFALLFVQAGVRHLSPKDPAAAFAAKLGVPAFAVKVAGLLAVVGGLSVMLGFYAQVGAWLLVLFLVPVTLTVHRFWGLPDAQQAMMHRTQFGKNLALIGAALLLTYTGAGPYSLT